MVPSITLRFVCTPLVVNRYSILPLTHVYSGNCVVECPADQPGLVCISFGDGVNMIMEKAGLKNDCVDNTIEAPDEAPGTTDPEMVTVTCSEWFMYIGWDRDVNRTLGHMRQEVLLKSANAVTAFAKGFKPELA